MKNSSADPEPARSATFPPVAGHVLIGWAAAVVMALADVVQSALRETALRVDPAEFAIASLHLVALYGVVGLAIGAGVGVLAIVARRSGLVTALWGHTGLRAFWLTPSPRGVARTLATIAAAGLVFAVVARAHVAVGTAFHRADLAGLLLAGATLATIAIAAGMRAALIRPLTSLAYRAGALATRAWLAALIGVAGAAGAIVFAVTDPQLLLAYEPTYLAWLPASVVAWLVCLLALGGRLGRTTALRVRVLATVIAATALVALGTSAVTFRASNRVRSVVEQRSVLGRRIIRSLAALTDRDGDRHSWAFGGDDCDDGDPRVHPGAVDRAGDGIDQDCFGGDGAPVIVERSRGHFAPPLPNLPRPNILVVTIDALRRDHLGAYGYERPTSPNIDRFLAQAVDFREVVPQSSRSLRSIPAMWTGNYPSEIAFGPEYLWPSLIDDENVTAAELLRDRAGYRTSVIMATDYFERMDDFFQGFEEVNQIDLWDPPRDRAVDEAIPELRRLTQSGSPWLLWVHLFNCHVPYLQDGHPSRYGPEQVDLYDTEIGLADEQLQRLLDALRELGAEQRTVVVLASDHGEAFGEHGSFGHASTLYEEEMRSVLAVRVPGAAPRRIEEPVGLLDVGPTIVNLAGTELTDDVSGISLVPYITGEASPDPTRPIFAELLPDGLFPFDIKVMRRGDRKLIWWVRDGTWQYFDLATDPENQHDLSDARHDEAQAMFGELRAWVANSARAENRSDAFVEQNRLRAVPSGISHPMRIRYPGMFTVVGVDLPRTRFHPGETIPLTFYYRVDDQIERDLFFYVDIDGPPGVRIPPHFHAWHYPLHSRYPTTRWVPGEVVRDPTPIVIPAELEVPARLRLVLRVRDGERILEGELGGTTHTVMPIAEIEIVPDGHRDAPPTD